MKTLLTLIEEVGVARNDFIRAASGLSFQQTQFKPAADAWSIVENVEHMVWAEQGGINGIWKTLELMKQNRPLWNGEAIHHGLSLESIIAKTWKEKEQVPETAKPRWGGPVEFWIAVLRNCQTLLVELEKALRNYDPEKIIYPHIISGPLNVIQRMEFLRFHLDRHRDQIGRIKAHPSFPK